MVRRSPYDYNWLELEFDETILTKHFTPQDSKKVLFVVAHHMVVRDLDVNDDDALDACYRLWQTRRSSAQYGVDGRFVRQFVWDKDYAWASGSFVGNKHGIHIEHVNYTLDEPGTRNDYLVSEETWQNGARLAAFIHKRYNLGRPVKDKTLRKHSSFKATACPGPYLGGAIWDKYVGYAQSVFERIDTKSVVVPPKPPTRGAMVDEAIRALKSAKGTGVRRRLIQDALTDLKKIKPL